MEQGSLGSEWYDRVTSSQPLLHPPRLSLPGGEVDAIPRLVPQAQTHQQHPQLQWPGKAWHGRTMAHFMTLKVSCYHDTVAKQLIVTECCLNLEHAPFWATQPNSHRNVSYRSVIHVKNKSKKR